MLARFKKIIIVAGFVVGAILSLQVSPAQDFFTAKEFDDRCVREGAVNLVDKLAIGYWDNPVWVDILENIASGDTDWIGTLHCLKGPPRYSNVTVSGDLNIMLATALPKNPKAVFTLGLSGIAIARACSLPFVEPERAWTAQYVKDTLAALEALSAEVDVANAPFDIERQVCALRLKDAYAKKYDYAD